MSKTWLVTLYISIIPMLDLSLLQIFQYIKFPLSLSLSLFFPSSFQLHDMNASLSSSSYSFPFFVLMFCLQSPNLFLHARVSARSPRCSRRCRQCLRSRCCVAPRLPRRHAQGRRHRAGPRPQGSAPAAASSSSIRRCFSRR